MKLLAQNTPPPEALVTVYTPAMRDLHHLNPNEPCSTDIPVGELEPSDATDTAVGDMEPPCPVEFLQPPNFTGPKDPNRLFYPMSHEELMDISHREQGKLGTLEQEIQSRRLRLNLYFLKNPTHWQVVDANNRLDDEEIAVAPDLYRRRVYLFRQLNKKDKPAPDAVTNAMAAK